MDPFIFCGWMGGATVSSVRQNALHSTPMDFMTDDDATYYCFTDIFF